VQVSEAPGKSEPLGHETADTVPLPEKLVSVTFTFDKVTLPVFFTTKL
jgi:hypothetical protein